MWQSVNAKRRGDALTSTPATMGVVKMKSRDAVASELARCEKEAEALRQHPEAIVGTAPNWLTAMGQMDWETEKQLILGESE